MSRGTLKSIAFVAALLLSITLGLGVAADAGGSQTPWLERLHRYLMRLHGHSGDGHGHQSADRPILRAHLGMMHLMLQLDLDDTQQARVEAMHGIFADQRQAMHEDHALHLAEVLERFEHGGGFDPVEARHLVDHHAEQLRGVGYAVVDEMTALANSLDDDQRAVVIDHLREVQGHLAVDLDPAVPTGAR
ncbi:MAG: Spy/CpxP family protein refolding chaperone [Acidobacteriota bacterium]